MQQAMSSVTDWITAICALLQTGLLAAAASAAYWEITHRRTEAQLDAAQTAYQDYLALAVEYPVEAGGEPATDNAEGRARYVRFVTYALAACEKIYETVLKDAPASGTTDPHLSEWQATVDQVLALHHKYLEDASRFSVDRARTYSRALRERIVFKYPSAKQAVW